MAFVRKRRRARLLLGRQRSRFWVSMRAGSRVSLRRPASGRDFAWRGPAVNPYARRQRQRGPRLKLLAAAVFFLTAIAVLLFHPFFHLTLVEVKGAERLRESDLAATVAGSLKQRRWLFFPGENYFFANLTEAGGILQHKFPLQTVTLSKKFPGSLLLAVKEKKPAVIYDNGSEYGYLDRSGVLIEKLRLVSDYEWLEIKNLATSTAVAGDATATVVTSTNDNKAPADKKGWRAHRPDTALLQREYGLYPLVFDSRLPTIELNETALPTPFVDNLVAWNNFVKETLATAVKYTILENEFGDATLKTAAGWELRARLGEGSSDGLAGLAAISREKINFKKLRYIDARYPGKIYWQ